MKRIYVLLIFFVSYPLNSYSIDYYYYQNQQIKLEPRNDKIAVVLKSNYRYEDVSDILKSIAGQDYSMKPVKSNIVLITFHYPKNIYNLEQITKQISEIKSSVKFSSPVFFGESKRVTQIVSDEYIVYLNSLSDKYILDYLNMQNNVKIIGRVNDEKGFLLRTDDNNGKNALEMSDIYYQTGIFRYAEPNFVFPDGCLLTMDMNDTYYSSQWAIKNTSQGTSTGGSTTYGDVLMSGGITDADMDVDIAWDEGVSGAGITVGVFDTGIDSLHPDLLGRTRAGYDAINNFYSVVYDSTGTSTGHGTNVAGLIGAKANNNLGVAGIAYNCYIMAFKIFNDSGTAENVFIARAFDTARVKNVDVLNNSWGGGTPVTVLTNAINNAAMYGRQNKGCIILFASGNDGRNPPEFPSYLQTVVSVGSSTKFDQKKSAGNGNQYYWGSNYGESPDGDIDCVAPTVCYSTDPRGARGFSTGDYYETFNGTSCSCPNASGVAALILSVNTLFTRNQVCNYLLRGCEKIDNVSYSATKSYGKWNSYYGYGRVNAYNSVKLAKSTDVIPPTINHTNVNSSSETYPVFINAEILDSDGGSVPPGLQKLVFRKRIRGGSWSAFDTIGTGNVYNNKDFRFILVCQGWRTEYQYYILARDYQGNTAQFPCHANPAFSYTLCYFAIGKMNDATNKISNWSPPDNAPGISSNVNFTNNNIILEARARIYLRHTQVNDNILYLWSPVSDVNNNRKCLFSRNGGSGDNITGATVCDSATQFWQQGTPPYTDGFYSPDYIMRGYNGLSAAGNWKFVNYDVMAGDAPVYDSIRINLKILDTLSSAAIRHDTPKDSTANFGKYKIDSIYFYPFKLINVGTKALVIDSTKFSGNFAYKFSVMGAYKDTINPGDSNEILIKLDPAALLKSSEKKNNNKILNDENPDDTTLIFENAILNIYSNDPSKNPFQVSLQTEDSPLPSTLLNITVIPVGFYNNATGTLNIKDTITAYIAMSTPPYTFIDSSQSVIDSITFTGAFKFYTTPSGNYYIVLKHRNSLETWSRAGGEVYSKDSVMNYDFTVDSTMAYGNNMVKVGTKWCIINGDCNRDNYIDGSDYLDVFNHYDEEGYLVGDTNGDMYVDGSDYLMIFNNYDVGGISPFGKVTKKSNKIISPRLSTDR